MKKVKRMGLRLPHAQWEIISAIARERGVTVSAYIRSLLPGGDVMRHRGRPTKEKLPPKPKSIVDRLLRGINSDNA